MGSIILISPSRMLMFPLTSLKLKPCSITSEKSNRSLRVKEAKSKIPSTLSAPAPDSACTKRPLLPCTSTPPSSFNKSTIAGDPAQSTSASNSKFSPSILEAYPHCASAWSNSGTSTCPLKELTCFPFSSTDQSTTESSCICSPFTEAVRFASWPPDSMGR